MNSPLSDAELEKAFIGRWVGSSERETIDFTFEAEHHFRIIETKKGEEPSKGSGYWDVLNGALRIGTSAATAKLRRLWWKAIRFG